MDSMLRSIVISHLGCSSRLSRTAYEALAAKEADLDIKYHNFIKESSNDKPLDAISLHTQKLKDVFLVTNLITDLMSRFTTQLETIFSLGRELNPNAITESTDSDLARLFASVFLVQKNLSKPLLKGDMPPLVEDLNQAQFILNLYSYDKNNKNNDKNSYKDLQNIINSLHEPYALVQLFKQNYSRFTGLVKQQEIPLLIKVLQNKLGEPLLKWTKQLLCVLNDFSSRFKQHRFDNRIESFTTRPDPNPKVAGFLQKARSDRDDLSSTSDQLYRDCGLGNNNEEVLSMREKIDATGGSVDKLIELFEQEKIK